MFFSAMERVELACARRHYAYLLRCADGSYYAGYTVDPPRRLGVHEQGRGSRYTRGRGPHRLVAVWRCPTRRAALILERVLKRLSHAAKQRLASGLPVGRVAPGARGLGARAVQLGNAAAADLRAKPATGDKQL